jgi:hypothetical protein
MYMRLICVTCASIAASFMSIEMSSRGMELRVSSRLYSISFSSLARLLADWLCPSQFRMTG